jgi:hypothetical protein
MKTKKRKMMFLFETAPHESDFLAVVIPVSIAGWLAGEAIIIRLRDESRIFPMRFLVATLSWSLFFRLALSSCSFF